MSLVIAPGDPGAPDVRALIAAHRAHAFANTPPENVFAMAADALLEADLDFFVAHEDNVLLAMGALRRMGDSDGELKSIHVAQAARGRGIGAAMLAHLIAQARGLGLSTLWLETGSMEAYAPSRARYARAGFERCGAFADYPDDPNSFFMKMSIA